jgi:diguanylate cyclase (GGDEF)-like protein
LHLSFAVCASVPYSGIDGGIHWEREINPPGLRRHSLNWRWGIGARLSVAFAAVAVLAIAANLLVQHEISVIRTTRLVRIAVPTSSLPAVVAPQLAARPLPEIEAMSPRALIAAIKHYEGAVRSRLDVDNDESDAQLATAVKDLERETQAYVFQPDYVGARHRLETLRARLAAYRSHGDELVRTADSRQDVLKEFRNRFEALDARTKASLARSWKIFGRVIARKSLVDLNTSLDAIRRSFASLPTTDAYDQGALDAVTVSETALTATLETNKLALMHSQGETWVMQMRADVAQISTLQESLIQLDTQRRVSLGSFAQESLTLMALAGATRSSSMARGVAPKAALQQGSSAPAPASTTKVGTLLPIERVPTPTGSMAAPGTAAGPLNEHTTESTSISSGKPVSAVLIFLVSAGVLVLLLGVSIHTIMSVVGPVRRMRAATRRLAGGEAGVQVTRGGIRELDDLALSFNQMAEQLADAQAVARSYQEQLEAKVDMRTRELRHLAEHDPLTQLPNRRQLFMHLTAAIARAAASNSYVGVFFLDLDNFKNINDSMGHAFGDHVLGAIAKRLRATAGPAGFAARLGGDEFTVVCDCAMSLEGMRVVGREMVRAFQQPISVDGRDLMISISVGASLYPDHGSDAEALLRAADAALFRAKALGRSQLTVFSPELLKTASAKFSTEQGLRHALERGEFELVFQPEVNATTLTTGLVEALLRWRQPDGRRASPDEFLTIAEESGLIMEISDWVLRTSIETASRWHHGAWPDARVAINLSSRQLLDNRFVDHVMDLLREHRLPAHCIEIELTENVLQTGAATIDVLRQLRAHGVAVALDDFGTGYSSLASLEQLPLTRVKLDRTLIASIHTSARSAAIARAIIGLCHGIGLEVTAEGIECPEQLELLTDLTPIYLQGYLLARPVSAEKLLPVMAALPNRMASLLLTSSAITDTPHDESSEEFSMMYLRAL